MTTNISDRVALLAERVGYEMHNFDCGNIDNTVIDPETEEVTTNFSLEQVIGAVNTDFTNRVNQARTDFSNDVTQAKSQFQSDVIARGVPVGTWIDFGGSTPPDGYLVRDGSAVSRTVYAELFQAIGTTYGAGDGSTTFNLPNSIDYPYTRSVIAEQVGSLFEAGLPNITGSIATRQHKAGNILYGGAVTGKDLSGAFKFTKQGATNSSKSGVEESTIENSTPEDLLEIDASQSSEIYGRVVNEVRPKSIGILPCIKAFDAPVQTGSVTVEELMDAVRDIRTNFMLLAHPIGSYYWSSEPTSPAVLFGGEWEAVTDKFILASGSRAVGSTGGEKSHSHKYGIQIGGYYRSIAMEQNAIAGALNGDSLEPAVWESIGSATADVNNNATNAIKSVSMTHYRSVADTSESLNMPPYEVAYCWRRTA